MSRTPFRRVRALVALVFFSALGPAGAAGWPEIKVPANARSELIASDMVLNGMPCRMFRFEAPGNAAEVQAFYRSEFGTKRVVENRVGGDPVIATRQGDYFVTVRMHGLPGRDAVEGTVMTTLTGAKPSSSTVLVETKQAFPPETQVVSSVQTNDGGKRSLVVVGVNRNSIAANRDHVVEALTQHGFRLLKSPRAEDDDSGGTPLWLQLASSTEQVSVTVSDSGGVRSVVINRIRDAK